MKGTVFDIKEFALNDGDGIRTTVFMKGCPLRCIWCHNPEGLSPKKQLFVKKKGCLNCGLCKKPCDHEDCKVFGRCLHVCPCNLISVAGVEWESDALAAKLLKQKDVLQALNGGITISGGEPLMQWEFTAEILSALKGQIHTTIETCGFASDEAFKSIISLCDFVYMDLKIFDLELHKKYTGVSNDVILKNAKTLMGSNVPHTFRIPLIPGITDTNENLSAIAEFVGDEKVELLPYNNLAGAKYESIGLQFTDKIELQDKNSTVLEHFKNATVRK